MMGKALLLAVGFSLVAASSAALADQPVVPLPKDPRSSCPWGYSPSGGYCAPMRDARPALPKVGSCPYGYSPSGNYCLAFDKKAREAVPKTGPCPWGYSPSGAYCLKSSVQ